MQKLKKFWEKISKWFIISRVLVTFWNGVIFIYHYLVVGIDPLTSIIIQGTGLIIEWLVSGAYEKWLLWSDKNISTRINVNFHKVIVKYVVFTMIFTAVYASTYCGKMMFFYLIGFGVDIEQLKQASIAMMKITPILAPIMAEIVIMKKKKKLHIWSHFLFIRGWCFLNIFLLQKQ